MAYIYIEPTERVFAKAYKMTYRASNTFPVDIKALYPNVDYTALTSNDFVCSYNSDGDNTWSTFSTGGTRDTWTSSVEALTITPSYNPQTGILTVQLSTTTSSRAHSPGHNDYHYGWSNLYVSILMIVDGIREEYS